MTIQHVIWKVGDKVTITWTAAVLMSVEGS